MHFIKTMCIASSKYEVWNLFERISDFFSKVNEWGLPMHLCWIFDLKDVNLNLNRQIFIQDVKKICESK